MLSSCCIFSLYNQSVMYMIKLSVVIVILGLAASEERALSGRFKRASEQKIIVPLKNRENTQYFFNIGIGTPEQQFTVQIDTGSFDLWVHSTVSRDGATVKQKFDRRKSRTCKSVNRDTFHFVYGDGGTYDGDVVTDVVTLKGKTNQVRIQQQAFGLVTSHSNHDSLYADGLIGLGLQSGSQFPGKPNPTIYSLMNQGFDPQIGLFLNRIGDGMEAELVFGGINEDLVEGEFAFAYNEDGHHNWAIMLDGISVNGVNIPNSNIVAMIDSGSSLVYAPSSIMDTINKRLWRPDQQFWRYPEKLFSCGEIDMASLPSITFYINNKAFDLPPEAYITHLKSEDLPGHDDIVQQLNSYPIPEHEKKRVLETRTRCHYTIAVDTGEYSYKDNERIIILGAPFMREFYTQFNFDDKIVGFAKARHGPRQLPPPTVTKPPPRKGTSKPTSPLSEREAYNADIYRDDSRVSPREGSASADEFPFNLFGNIPISKPGQGGGFAGTAEPISNLPQPSGISVSPATYQQPPLDIPRQTPTVPPTSAVLPETHKPYVQADIPSGNFFVRTYKRITNFFSYYYNKMLVVLLNMITR